MLRSYRIRLARRRDIHRLPAIERDASRRFLIAGYLELHSEQTLPLEVLEHRQSIGRLWVALDARDRPVGFAAASIVDGYAHIDELDVSLDHGRKGIGSRLVKAVCRWARRQRLHGVTLSTQREVPWNAPFYQRLGFAILAETELSEGLLQVRVHETAAGLPVDERVIMLRAL